jgi:hypothetical protein
MKLILLLFTFCLSTFSFCFCQDSRSFQIKDSQNNPIVLANVSLNQTSIGTYTNSNGEFSVENIKLSDTLKISCIGYKSRSVCVKDVEGPIILISSSINIDEVTINGKRNSKSFKIGFYKMRSILPYTHGSSINTKLATFLPYESSPAFIEKILLPITNANDTTQLRIFLYDVSEDGSPGKEVYSKIAILKDIKNKVDVSDQKIRMPLGGIFVGVEWLFEPTKPEDLNNIEVINRRHLFSLKMTPVMDTNYTYMYWKNKWRLSNIDADEFRNARFGLELKYL